MAREDAEQFASSAEGDLPCDVSKHFQDFNGEEKQEPSSGKAVPGALHARCERLAATSPLSLW